MLNKALYLVLAVNLEGQKELLGMWIAQTEGARVLALSANESCKTVGSKMSFLPVWMG